MANNYEKYSQRKLNTSYISTVVGITLVLFMLGLLGLILLHANRLSNYVKENIGFTVFLNDDVKEVDIIQLQKTLDARNYVKSTEFISSDKAAKNLQKDIGEDFVTFLGYNPLPSSIEVRFKADYANTDSLKILQAELNKNSFVKEVSYQESLVTQVNENLRKISLIILGFSALLMIISIALINNTIRLSVFSKRFLIRTMQLIGATENFIRRPFLFKGMVQGIIASVIAIILLVFTLYFAQKEIPELQELQDALLFIKLFIFVMVLGIIISWASTYFAVKKYLRIKTDYLYNH
ncbi:MAG TPA: permease-like cell division protein FtsX [Bacteroidales bacterium]|nr:permease-like cell division protein FtsX [Bacteroidales bacterium]HPS17539.1 permease-like cell division protein FtsX [Bacteroidales bacterium]